MEVPAERLGLEAMGSLGLARLGRNGSGTQEIPPDSALG